MRPLPTVVAIIALLTSVVNAPASGQNPFQGKRLYVDPNGPAARQAREWERSRPADAALMRRIAEQPQVLWAGDWMRDVRGEVGGIVSRIAGAGAYPVLVAYNIPNRDCGSHSRGGAGGADAYRRWIDNFAAGLGRRGAAIVIEPDALPANDCLPMLVREERYALIRHAVETFKRAGAAVYIDAGHARWKSPEEMADRLRKAGIDLADGFSLNISNFHTTQANVAYGDRLSRLVGNKHYIIDTSRNGAGGSGEWCNPRGQALGPAPTTNTGLPLVDAFLWIKVPGQSDGECGGGPRAGQWWADYALELSRMAQTLGSMVPRITR